MNEELEKILEEIEKKLLEIKRTIIDTSKVKTQHVYHLQFFEILFYLQYKSVIDLHEANDKADIAILIAQSDHPHKEEIGKMWMEHEDSVSHSFIPQWIRLLEDYDFSPYQSIENEWCIFI